MAEYVNENKPLIFKNETNSDFSVGVGIVFRKSGIYEIFINDKTTTVTNIAERKTGKWEGGVDEHGIDGYHCDNCGFFVPWDYTHRFIAFIEDYHYCPHCGAEMRSR